MVAEKIVTSIRVDPELWRRFKLRCVSEGRNMSWVLAKLVAEWLSAENDK